MPEPYYKRPKGRSLSTGIAIGFEYLNLSDGLAKAALTIWKLIMVNAINIATATPNTNEATKRLIL